MLSRDPPVTPPPAAMFNVLRGEISSKTIASAGKPRDCAQLRAIRRRNLACVGFVLGFGVGGGVYSDPSAFRHRAHTANRKNDQLCERCSNTVAIENSNNFMDRSTTNDARGHGSPRTTVRATRSRKAGIDSRSCVTQRSRNARSCAPSRERIRCANDAAHSCARWCAVAHYTTTEIGRAGSL